MLRAIVNFLKAFFGCGQAVAEEIRQHEQLKNAPDVKQGVMANQVEGQKQAVTKATAEGNLEQVRENFSE